MRDSLWNLFCDTGDPLCWLCYRAAGVWESSEHQKDRSFG